MARTLVRRTVKITFYIILSIAVGRTIGPPETWINYGLAEYIGNIIYGPGEIGADNFYDLYFYMDVIVIFSITTIIYLLAMKLFNKIRSK